MHKSNAPMQMISAGMDEWPSSDNPSGSRQVAEPLTIAGFSENPAFIMQLYDVIVKDLLAAPSASGPCGGDVTMTPTKGDDKQQAFRRAGLGCATPPCANSTAAPFAAQYIFPADGLQGGLAKSNSNVVHCPLLLCQAAPPVVRASPMAEAAQQPLALPRRSLDVNSLLPAATRVGAGGVAVGEAIGAMAKRVAPHRSRSSINCQGLGRVRPAQQV
jgi:hypothetical protein